MLIRPALAWRSASSWSWRLAAGGWVWALAAGAAAGAPPVLVSSSATITHASNFGSVPATRVAVVSPLPDFPTTLGAVPLQLANGQLVAGAAQTTAKGGVGTVTSTSFLGVILAPATALTQKGNANAAAATASTLTISYSATWYLSEAFGPASAGVSAYVAGSLPSNPPPGPNVPSPTAFYALAVSPAMFSISDTNPPGVPVLIRPTISTDPFQYTNIQGPFANVATLQDLVATSPSPLPFPRYLTISGTFVFKIHNDGTVAEFYPLKASGAGIAINMQPGTIFHLPGVCVTDYNQDGNTNPDDLGDFITDYFTTPPIPGPGGFAVRCPDNAAPYNRGYVSAYTSDGTPQCGEPNPDNLGDFITDYFIQSANGCQPPPPPCPADFNHDGIVDAIDLVLFQQAFASQAPGPGGFAHPCPGLPPPFDQGYQADVNGDCQVNSSDFAAFQQLFNQGCP